VRDSREIPCQKIDDIRETRVYKEAQEEGREEERQKQMLHYREANKKMAAAKFAPEDIAYCLDLDISFVREELTKSSP
jgi:predicted transposase YdaD